MDIGFFRGLITVLLLVLFIGLGFWTWSKKRDSEFETAAQLPLEDSDHPPENFDREQGK